MLVTVRVVLATALVGSVLMLPLPFLVGTSLREGAVGNVGITALVILFSVVPLWLWPYAMWQTGTVRLDGNVLTAYTLRNRRVLDLSRVSHVKVWSLDARGIWAKLSGPGLPPVWLNWSGFGGSTSDRLRDVVREVAAREGVTTNPAARDVFELADRPSGWANLLRWVRDLAIVGGYGVVMAAALIAYVNMLFGFAPWTGP